MSAYEYQIDYQNLSSDYSSASLQKRMQIQED